MRSFRDPSNWAEWVPALASGQPARSTWVEIGCNRSRGHVLIEGHRPGHKSVFAAITAGAALEVIGGLRYRLRHAVTVPAFGTGLEEREFTVVDPGDDSAVLTIVNRFGSLGSWSIHADRIPELSWALKHAHTLAAEQPWNAEAATPAAASALGGA
ncbi:hypothetical protein [Actinoalloteichus hymeniacidonis]|uniref:Uncharacterized protein n=1 Tax=Actinoalloteichus hymeniacidonis TaxID=340345 RepID=A0AAC9HTT6_9PSEU|nr:hypothetical protein [Actinoalloteichus hymeniacidonis]AOS65275.1 hypothetical protein TL08_22465 [Actinoalloteichus hymeniacidonis]MBB5906642.1 hypothetical protein [Actinoalloteichus hymeniacidonis]